MEYPKFEKIPYFTYKRQGRFLDERDGEPRFAKTNFADILIGHGKWETGYAVVHFGKNDKPDSFEIVEAGRRLGYSFPYTEEGWAKCLAKLQEIYKWQRDFLQKHIDSIEEATRKGEEKQHV